MSMLSNVLFLMSLANQFIYVIFLNMLYAGNGNSAGRTKHAWPLPSLIYSVEGDRDI